MRGRIRNGHLTGNVRSLVRGGPGMGADTPCAPRRLQWCGRPVRARGWVNEGTKCAPHRISENVVASRAGGGESNGRGGGGGGPGARAGSAQKQAGCSAAGSPSRPGAARHGEPRPGRAAPRRAAPRPPRRVRRAAPRPRRAAGAAPSSSCARAQEIRCRLAAAASTAASSSGMASSASASAHSEGSSGSLPSQKSSLTCWYDRPNNLSSGGTDG